MEGVVSVFPNTIYNLHTTRSWDFMGMTTQSTLRYPLEGDVIIGMIDTGIKEEEKTKFFAVGENFHIKLHDLHSHKISRSLA